MEKVNCKYCQSANVIKYGTFEGKQRYWCKDCQRKFVPNTLPKMKTPMMQIASALGNYFGGMPLDAIQRQQKQDYGTYLSESGIYNWVIRFGKEAVEGAKAFTPKVGNVWIADETMIDAEGKKFWFWDIIDRDTRYLIASHLTSTRTTKDARILMEKAYRATGKAPKKIITDRLRSYIDAIELTFGADTKHIQSRPFIEGDSTNQIERFHGTLKDRMNVVRGFKNIDTARLLTDAWLVHYNFFKEHTSLGDVPPAQSMGIPVPFKDWNDVVKNTSVIIPTLSITTAHTVIRHRRKPAKRLARHKPTMPSIATVRTKRMR